MTMFFKSVKKKANAGVGAGINQKIIIFDWDDVLISPKRVDLIVIEDALVFKPNAFMIELEVTEDSIKNMSKDEGDNDAVAVMQEVAATVPGNELEFRQLVASLRGRKLGVIHRYCGGNIDPDLYGSRCAPLKFTNSFEHDKDNKKSTINLKSLVKGPDVAVYKGPLNFELDMTLDSNENTIDLAQGNGVFKVGDNTSATSITTVSNASHGDKFSINGSGSTNLSSIASSSTFLMRDGATWQAMEGSVISFKMFDNGTNLVAVEQSRS